MDTPSPRHFPIKSIPFPVQYEEDTDIHSCKELEDENRFRQLEGDSRVYLFRDDENKTWNMKVGLEFVRMNRCPFCGAKL